MDGSAGVDREVRRQRRREMHTEEATKETKTEGFLHIRTFAESPCGQFRWRHPSMVLKQAIVLYWVIFWGVNICRLCIKLKVQSVWQSVDPLP